MKIGVISDSISAGIEAEKAGAQVIVFCQGLLAPGAGTTPTVGAVATLASLSTLQIYVLLRPEVGDFIYNAVNKQVLLNDIQYLASMPRVAGFVFAAQCAATLEVDVSLTKEVVACALGKEVWYHRAYMCLKSEKDGFEQMKEAGVTGVILSLHGEVSEDKVQYAYDRLEMLESTGLMGMIVGSIDKLYRQQVIKGLSKFVLSKTLHSWLLTLPVTSQFEGALLPWRDWDIGSYLWPDVKTQRLELESVSPLISQYVALETGDDSPSSTIAPPPA